MIGGKIDFDKLRWDFGNRDITDNHRYNYLRHKRWMKENRKKELKN